MKTRILWALRFSLVCLVTIPHFDSSFDETDHVFILNREGEAVKKWGGKKGKRRKRQKELKMSGIFLIPDLKEGECCPLQEALSVANFSVEFLWGENHMSQLSSDRCNGQTHKHTHTHQKQRFKLIVLTFDTLYTCNAKLKVLTKNRTLLTFGEVFRETWLLALPDWESKNPSNTGAFVPLDFLLSSKVPSCISLIISFYTNQWLHLFPVKTACSAEDTIRCWLRIKCLPRQSKHWKNENCSSDFRSVLAWRKVCCTSGWT